MSSSNRDARPCDAVLMHNQEVVGPLRLPMNRADDFIAHFNRVYAGLGISLIPKLLIPSFPVDEANDTEATGDQN